MLFDDTRVFIPRRNALFFKGYEVVCFSSGEPACSAINERRKYDLLVVDLSLADGIMENISGIDVCKLSKEINPNTPVISYSGYELLDVQKPSGANVHVVKRCDVSKLFDIIESYIEMSRER